MFHKVVWQRMQGVVGLLGPNNWFTANLPRNLPVKKIVNRLRFDRIMVMSLWPHFFAHPLYAIREIGSMNKKLNYHRGTARCVVSIEILPIATQQCRNYLYKS